MLTSENLLPKQFNCIYRERNDFGSEYLFDRTHLTQRIEWSGKMIKNVFQKLISRMRGRKWEEAGSPPTEMGGKCINRIFEANVQSMKSRLG